jgi:hypothetical protein
MDEEVGEDETSLWVSNSNKLFSINIIFVEGKEYSSTHPCNCASIKKPQQKAIFLKPHI